MKSATEKQKFSYEEPKTMKDAIFEHCMKCTGHYKDDVYHCWNRACVFWPFRNVK